jgi:hypothetical protein
MIYSFPATTQPMGGSFQKMAPDKPVLPANRLTSSGTHLRGTLGTGQMPTIAMTRANAITQLWARSKNTPFG